VKNLFVIIFAITHLLTSAQFSELFKLPIVAEHFDEHQTEDANLTIWEFISIHYMHGEVDDDDFDKDMKLPFKSLTFSNTYTITFCNPLLDYELPKNVFFKSSDKKTIFGYQFSFSADYFNSIWQPPKFS
jgi:hypothetical protein